MQILNFLNKYLQSLFVVSLACQVGALVFMNVMAKATFTDTGSLLDAGLDLNMEGGFGECVLFRLIAVSDLKKNSTIYRSCKDIIILTFVTQVLALFTRYFWIILLSVRL